MSIEWFQIDYCAVAAEDFHSGNGLAQLGRFDSCQNSEYRDGVRFPLTGDDAVRGLLRDACRRLKDMPSYQGWWSAQEYSKRVTIEELYKEFFVYAAGDSCFVRALRVPSTAPGTDHFHAVSRTAIDQTSRRAEDGTLRVIECGRAGLPLTTSLRARTNAEQQQAALQFLSDGFRLLRHHGGGKQRGLGELHEIVVSPRVPVHKYHDWKGLLDASPSDGPVALLLTIEALEPLMLTAGTQVGNLLRGLGHVPGSVLLGALRHEWQHGCVGVTDESTRSIISGLLAEDGAVSFGNLMPLLAGAAPPTKLTQLPFSVPLSWQYPKGKAGDTLAERGTLQLLWENADGNTEPLKRLDTDYAQDGIVVPPPLTLSLRNRVDEKTRKVGQNALFTEEKIVAGTKLSGAIYFRDAQVYQQFVSAFGHLFLRENDYWLGIGGGRRPARVVAATPVSPVSNDCHSPKSFVLHLTSDCICRDAWLRFHGDLQSVLEQEIEDFPYQMEKQFARTGSVRTFSPVGGLPGFPALAILARSSFKFSSKPGANKAELEKAWARLCTLSLQGLGERTAAGFGRFLLETEKCTWKAPDAMPQSCVPASNNSRDTCFSNAKAFAGSIKGAEPPGKRQWRALLQALEGKQRAEWTETINTFVGRDTEGGGKWEKFRAANHHTELSTRLAEHGLLFLEVLIRYLPKEGDAQ